MSHDRQLHRRALVLAVLTGIDLICSLAQLVSEQIVVVMRKIKLAA